MRRVPWTFFLVVALAVAGSPASGAAEVPGSGEPRSAPGARFDSDFDLELTAGLWAGSLRGITQTPRGGEPGTTSPQRPAAEEVGLDGYQALPTLDLRLGFLRSHELHVSYVPLLVEGTDTLSEPLVSQAISFPAGAAVDSSLDVYLARLGYGARWLDPGLEGWRFVPEIGFAVDLFAFQLHSPRAADSVDRSFSAVYPYLGFLLGRDLSPELRLEADLAASAGLAATLIDTELRLVYTPIRRERLRVGFVFGVRGLWVRRLDGQSELRNDYNLRFGAFNEEPWGGVTFGVRVAY